MAVYDTLNPKQREAVFHTEGPLLVLAGAGSGKTRVLTHRIAYLIEEKGVNPWNILAITFTNKAAGEMRERVDRLVESGSGSIWVSTFHSCCVRILRRFIEYLGYENNFTIYDSDDQKTLVKQVIKKLDLDPKQFRERMLMSVISTAKNELIGPEEFMRKAEGDWRQKKEAEVYMEYQQELKRSNALDFDDLIFKTVDLFQANAQVLEYYQERFRYILVDEYQDTNRAQFQMVSLLAGKYKNLCVVGDDDQSIYKFRGADIRNILDFEEVFPGAKVIRLEQNYRSTGHILDAANAVISNNVRRKGKTLWTANEQGALVSFRQYGQAYQEAEGIIHDILKVKRPYREYAVLYRTNAQSRLLEEMCIQYNIPYRLVGGVNFYQRKEIKDILCYLKTIANGKDNLAVQRIINVPKRGIGAASIGKIMAWIPEGQMSFYEGCAHAASVPGIGKAAGKIQAFVSQIEGFRLRLQEWEQKVSAMDSGSQNMEGGEGQPEGGRLYRQEDRVYGLRKLITDILEETGYRQELEAEGEEEAKERLQNIGELINKAVSYAQETEHPSLDGFLEEVALVADIDQMDQSEDRVTLMTLHSAKGLEFPIIYLSGLEDGLFPSSRSIMSDDPTDLEEERRLCYVGITRAKERLTLTAARTRLARGELHYSPISRFVEEIPEELIDGGEARPGTFPGGGQRDGSSPFGPGSPDRGKEGLWGGQGSMGGKSILGKQSQAGSRGAFGQPGRMGAGNPFGQSPKVPAFGKAFTVQKAAALDYQAGDRVRHMKFGEGTVRDIQDGPKDYEVTVDFDRTGTRRLFASVAKLQRL
ncbi:MAG: UvrD-helicase domain-containing protein [Lachnospiraceae bacterium]|nr:UvrD-helicase domain-containing protein [Lachnospiraceae bacterium]